jgi:hypothetical protein
LKGKYSIWKKLTNKQTGIGWDAGRKNIDMLESWWKLQSKVNVFVSSIFFVKFDDI